MPRKKKAEKDPIELFDGEEEEAGGEDKLEISEKYAKKYNQRKDREELTKARRILAEEDDDSYSETDSEDEQGALLTDKVEDQIFNTLKRIRNKDPKIYDEETVFFKDDDFEDEDAGPGEKAPKEKKVTLKDHLRTTLLEEGAEALTKAEEEYEAEGKKKNSSKSEEQDLRKAIISAAHNDDGEGDDDDDLFTIKEKTPAQMKKEQEEYEAFEAKKAKDRARIRNAKDVTEFWDDEAELDDNEKFLRDYIMNKAWQETTSMQPKIKGDDDSDESEEQLDKADDFEREYNFRFEMEDGQQIQGHKRNPENSVRQKNDKRKRQRQEKAERKEEEKIRRIEELKRLKNIKKKEIMKRLQQIAEVTGNEEIPIGSINLDAEFDPDKHDEEMGVIFDKKYEEAEDNIDEDDLLAAPTEELDVSKSVEEWKSKQGGLTKKSQSSTSTNDWEGEGEDWNGDEQAEGEGEGEWQGGDGDGDAGWEGGEDGGEDEEVDPEEWWMCDECQTGIPGGKQRFDCQVCENYTLCKKCFRVRRHRHPFSRKRVPAGCMPPEDLKELKSQPAEVDKVLDEYFQLDYEDIIGGDLPTRFKYQQVKPNDCGLTAEEILKKSDKELNRIVPLKKLRTYRDDDDQIRKEALWKVKNQKFKEKEGGAKFQKKGDQNNAKKAKGGMTSDRLKAYGLDKGSAKRGSDGNEGTKKKKRRATDE
mmetsp:Transcript_58732/g.128930  ORF Transcript_58732/g.128930 Transcript_58732/m.128930 type:complete len:700 (+) Transcript_58732:68-2167(+)